MPNLLSLDWFLKLSWWLRILTVLGGAWLLVVAWPIVAAAVFGLVVWSTMQSPKLKYGLVVTMLVPALLMEGLWAGSVWAGMFGGEKDAVANKPSAVAQADYDNQVQAAQTSQKATVRVLTAINGGTIDIDQKGKPYRVKLIGVSSPEPSECFAQESTQFLNSLLENRNIELIEDSVLGDADEDGNLWRYVRMSDGTKVNELMLEAGLAKEGPEGDYEQKDIYVSLADSAKKNIKGLWATCAENGQPKITPVPSVVKKVTPSPTVVQTVPTGVAPINPN